jgi:hypothetical protein
MGCDGVGWLGLDPRSERNPKEVAVTDNDPGHAAVSVHVDGVWRKGLVHDRRHFAQPERGRAKAGWWFLVWYRTPEDQAPQYEGTKISWFHVDDVRPES